MRFVRTGLLQLPAKHTHHSSTQRIVTSNNFHTYRKITQPQRPYATCRPPPNPSPLRTVSHAPTPPFWCTAHITHAAQTPTSRPTLPLGRASKHTVVFSMAADNPAAHGTQKEEQTVRYVTMRHPDGQSRPRANGALLRLGHPTTASRARDETVRRYSPLTTHPTHRSETLRYPTCPWQK